MEIKFNPKVYEDLEHEFNYYRTIEPELGQGFIQDYENTLSLVERDCLRVRTFYKENRKVNFKRFKKFAIVFEVTQQQLYIKAVCDLRKKPFYWKNR